MAPRRSVSSGGGKCPFLKITKKYEKRISGGGPKMSPKIFVFHYKKKVFGANRVLKNISEKDEHLEKKVPGNVRSWAPKWTSKS